jgi:hypothetical protein
MIFILGGHSALSFWLGRVKMTMSEKREFSSLPGARLFLWNCLSKRSAIAHCKAAMRDLIRLMLIWDLIRNIGCGKCIDLTQRAWQCTARLLRSFAKFVDKEFEPSKLMITPI